MITKKILTEWSLYILLIMMFIINIGAAFFTIDLGHQIKQSIIEAKQSRDLQLNSIEKNQEALICVYRGFLDPKNYVNPLIPNTMFIDKCINK